MDIRKFIPLLTLIGFTLGSFGIASAVTVFNSNQVGSSPSNGYILQTNGTVSTWVVNTAGTPSVGTLSTSTTPSIGGLAYWTGLGWPSTLGTVATGTVSGSGPITATAGQSVIGSGLTIGCATCNTSNATVSSIATTYPLTGGTITTTGTIGFAGLGTTSPFTIGNLAMVSSSGSITSVATTSATCGSGVSCTAHPVIGSVNPSFALTAINGNSVLGNITSASAVPTSVATSSLFNTAAAGVTGLLSGTDWSTFNNKGSGTVTSAGAGTGIGGGAITTTGTHYLLSYVATSSAETNGQLAYWGTTGGTPAGLRSVGTTSETCSSPLSCGAFSVVGAGGGAISLGTVAIANGGTATTTAGNTNGVEYYDGTRITNSSALTFDATKLILNYASSTSISGTNSYFTTASSTNLTVSGVVSALLKTGASGVVSAYGGASACSANNFVTALSALGASTCGTASISGVNLGGNLAAHTVSGSITGTSYNGSAAVSDWTLNMANANTWTALQTINQASTTNLTAANFQLPNAAACAPGALGWACLDTTDSQLQIATSSNAFYSVFPSVMPLSVAMSSSTWGTGTTTIFLRPPYSGEVFKYALCATDAGTLEIDLYHASSSALHMQSLQASTTVGQFNYSLNTGVPAKEIIKVDIGTAASAPTKIGCGFWFITSPT